jgi:hypothetical protein
VRPKRFYDVIRIGPVKVGTYNNGPWPDPAHRRLHRPRLRLLHRPPRPLSRRTLRPHPPLQPLTEGEEPVFTPKYPPPDTAPATPVPAPSTDTTPAPAPVLARPVSNRPTVQLTPGSALALAAGGGAVVLVVGEVLVSMLLAVAITGVSVALVAVVLRILVKDLQKGR